MMKKQKNKNIQKISFLLFFGSTILASNISKAVGPISLSKSILDSIGTEVIQGKRYVLHKVAVKETYYELSRVYKVPVKDIMEANNKKGLLIGDIIKIPRNSVQIEPKNETQKTEKVLLQEQEIFTEYKVGKNETLYAISKRFDVSVETIKKANNLKSNSLKEGQLLKIPSTSIPEPVVEVPIVLEEPKIEELPTTIDDSDFKANKYGIREKKERGIGVWSSNFGDGQSLALHKTAPIGTILKITNPMNKNVTFAKVVGKFVDNEETQGAIVVISKSVATSMGLIDRKFQIELNYGTPLD